MKYLEKIKTYPIHWALGGQDKSGGLEQNAIELAMFCEWLEKNEVKTFLEIGMAKGLLSKFLTIEIGIECSGVTFDGSMLQWRTKELYVGDSIELADKVGSYDLVFVDGDHYQVADDYKAYKDKARFIAFHDILGLRDCEPVKNFWNTIKKQYKSTEFVDKENPNDASGIGIIDLNSRVVSDTKTAKPVVRKQRRRAKK
jgi:hypothetical protein